MSDLHLSANRSPDEYMFFFSEIPTIMVRVAEEISYYDLVVKIIIINKHLLMTFLQAGSILDFDDILRISSIILGTFIA